MPRTEVVFYADENKRAPLLTWFADLPEKVQDKLTVRIERLAELGHELRRPEADFLRDGIYELRVRHQRVNYRILYFFYKKVAVLFAGLTKEAEVPDTDINRAIAGKKLFAGDPGKHTFEADKNGD